MLSVRHEKISHCWEQKVNSYILKRGNAMKKKLLSSDETYLRLGRRNEFQKFFRGLIKFLQKKLKKVEVEEGRHYYTCGRRHERHSQIWQSFPNLWVFSERRGFDFYACKNLIDEFFFRELKCECEILCGDKEIRRRELERSGVYFGENPGQRDCDVF